MSKACEWCLGTGGLFAAQETLLKVAMSLLLLGERASMGGLVPLNPLQHFSYS